MLSRVVKDALLSASRGVFFSPANTCSHSRHTLLSPSPSPSPSHLTSRRPFSLPQWWLVILHTVTYTVTKPPRQPVDVPPDIIPLSASPRTFLHILHTSPVFFLFWLLVSFITDNGFHVHIHITNQPSLSGTAIHHGEGIEALRYTERQVRCLLRRHQKSLPVSLLPSPHPTQTLPRRSNLH